MDEDWEIEWSEEEKKLYYRNVATGVLTDQRPYRRSVVEGTKAAMGIQSQGMLPPPGLPPAS